MRGFGATTRILLIGVIALILGGYGWWFLAPRRSPVALEIEIQRTMVNFWPADSTTTPTYIDSTSDWLAEGRHMRSIASYAEVLSGITSDKRDTGKFVYIQLPADADRGVMQRAMAALASEGICLAVVRTHGHWHVPLIRIVRFTDAAGRSRSCRDVFRERPGH